MIHEVIFLIFTWLFTVINFISPGGFRDLFGCAGQTHHFRMIIGYKIRQIFDCVARRVNRYKHRLHSEACIGQNLDRHHIARHIHGANVRTKGVAKVNQRWAI